MQTLSHLAVGSLWLPRMKMSHRRTAGPTGTTIQGEKTRQRTTQKGIHVKPLTTYLPTRTLHKAIWLLLIHQLHMFAGGFIPTGVFPLLSYSALYNPTASCHLFVKEGPEAVPAEHGIAMVHHSCQQCLLPEIYIIFSRAPASVSTPKVTEHWGHCRCKC